ncbi:hypothetical protein [Ghiorsea bivora]|uniref:hypothetical protein n=1 Tax=Ghiorsea bivora TaxID=1485545 RepID=UPI000570CFC6|nr:hypothetical protein [Ghiorsea bivora]
MNIKWIQALAVAGGLLSMSTTASALAQYVSPLNTALGTTGLSCEACHAGYPAVAPSRATITLPMGLTQAARLPLGTTDSDQDGFTNVQEASGTSLDFNNKLVTPFTKAVATTNDVKLPNVFVQGDTQATEFAITDIYAQAGITIPAGKEVMGGATVTAGVAVDIYATPSAITPVTLLFKAGAPDMATMVYVIDTYAQTNTPIAATGWAIAPNGGVQIKLLPNGTSTPARIAVVRTIPVAPTTLQPGINFPNLGGDNENDGEGSGVGGCITGVPTLPLLMFGGLLALGLVNRRKQSI